MLRTAASVARFVWDHPANRGRRLRQLGRATRFQLEARLLGKRTQTSIGEKSRIWVDLHRNGASKALYANPPDVPEMLVWRQRLSAGDRFFDVGANVGCYTLWAAELGARVVALEPAPDTFGLLSENVALNGYDVRLLNAAASSDAGVAHFSSGRDTVNHLDSSGPIMVATVALDDVIGSDIVDGMKVDVEGFEYDVLLGCWRALRDHRIRLLQLEWNSSSLAARGHDRSDVAALLATSGYGLFRPDEQGTLHPVDAPGFGADVFAAPVDRHLP